MRKWLVMSCALAVMGAVWGCDRNDEADGDPRVVLSEEWPEEPRRVVSMAPNVTELLFELGVGDRVVAVTRYCDWPEEVEELPTIGGMLDPDFEALLSVSPDVVVGVKDGADHRMVERLDRADIAYGFVAMDDLSTIRRGVEDLGRWLGREEEAARSLERFDAEVKAASRRLREDVREGTTALMVFDREPVVAAGPGSYGAELLELAGFDNALGPDVGTYPVLDVERLLIADPEVVIDVTMDAGDAEGNAYWERFDTITAVAEGRVIRIDDPVMMRPGVRIPKALDELHRALESP